MVCACHRCTLKLTIRTNHKLPMYTLHGVFRAIKVAKLFFVQTLKGLLRLWCHECNRVFEDRLVNTEDRDWFQNLLKTRLAEDFQMESGEVLGDGPLLYGDFMVANTDNKLYEEITDQDKVCIHVCTYVHGANSSTGVKMLL